MEKLFAIPMGGLAAGMAIALILAVGTVGVLAIRNPVLVKIAVRNIPRRRAQSVLIVIGLMLSTTIITASLVVGDTISSSIRQTALNGLRNTDITVGSPLFAAFGDDYLSADLLAQVHAVVDDDPRIDGVMPQIRDTFPIVNPRASRTEVGTSVIGLDTAAQAGFAELRSLDGEVVPLDSLGQGEILLNEDLAEELDARTGDVVLLVASTGRHELTVRAVVESRGLAGSRPGFQGPGSPAVAIVALRVLQRLLDREGQVDQVEISIRGDARPDRKLSDEVTKDLRLAFTDREVAREIFQLLRAGDAVDAIDSYAVSNPDLRKSLKLDLEELVAELRKDTVSDDLRSLLADNEVAATAVLALEEAGMRETVVQAIALLSRLETLRVDDIKSRVLDIANLVGSFFTSIFAILGSFSIMVGLLLIFLVFVMLAAARSTEMGIARAVGTKRGQLVQTFVFEGTVYAVAASLAGTILGILASLALVQVLTTIVPEDVDFTIRYNIQFRSLVVAFSAGMLITLLTVVISAYRVSRLNIAVAIRGLREEFVTSETPPLFNRAVRLGQAILGPLYLLYRAWTAMRRGYGWRLTVVAALATAIPLVWLARVAVAAYQVVSPYLGLGWPVAILGILIAIWGMGLDSAALFSIGASALFIGIGLFVRVILRRTTLREEVVSRISYTVMGVLLLSFWSLPFDALESLTGELNGDFEMFFLSGAFLVAAAVWIVMHNTELVLWPLIQTVGRFGRLRPVLATAIAYPMAAKFRTGLTLAMFALIIFTLMVFAVINRAFSNTILNDPDRATGGYEISATISRDRPIDDIEAAIAEAPGLSLDDFAVIAASAELPAEARQAGPYLGEEIEDRRFRRLGVHTVGEPFLKTNLFQLSHFDTAFGSTDREIWEALAADSSLAVVDAGVLGGNDDFGGAGFGSRFRVQGIGVRDDEEIEAFTVELRPPLGTGEPVTRTVIAIIDPAASVFSNGGSMIHTGASILGDLATRPVPLTRYDFRLSESVRAEDVAPTLETAFLDYNMEARVNEEELRESVSFNQAFNQLFQGFMGLGLLVGVASLGVMSFRAVVERRQAIGLLRAIGFKSRMIQAQFLIESSLIALLGIVLGLALGSLVSWNLLNDLNKEFGGLTFSVPWLTVAIIVAVAYTFSLLMAIWPARQAAQIFPAEALRYE